MAETSETLEASPADVWAVLTDPKTYEYFVVGTKRVRRHDPDWPRPGATLEHTAGIGPLVLHDSSTVVASEPERRLVLEARFRPFGAATVEFRLQRDCVAGGAVARPGNGTGRERIVLVVDENPVAGPIALPIVRRLTAALFVARNRELLRRVRRLVTERSR